MNAPHKRHRAPALVAAALALSGAAFFVLPEAAPRPLLALFLALLAGASAAYALVARGARPVGGARIADLEGLGPAGSAEAAASLRVLLEATLSGMREGVLVLDRQMRVIASNAAVRDVFAYYTSALESRRLTELTRNRAIYSAFLDALKGEERAGVKVETYGPERRVFDLRVSPLGPSREGARGAVGVFFDITRLERLERVRQEFLSNVSHELRTPLTAILAFVETLESGAIDDAENSRRFLSIIGRNASRMHDLIDDILELGAIEAGNAAVEPAPVLLCPVVEEVFAALAPKAEARGVRLVNEVGAQVRVTADERRVGQMLTNLVDNAVKFNREGGAVTVRHERRRQDEIVVEDTGEGIPPEHLARLFERFYRVDKARSRELGGTGLGLSIVKHLARAHGGEVTVESRPGEGSRFIVRLPRPAGDGPGRP